MTNDEIPNNEGMTNSEARMSGDFVAIELQQRSTDSAFGIRISFVMRHSSLTKHRAGNNCRSHARQSVGVVERHSSLTNRGRSTGRFLFDNPLDPNAPPPANARGRICSARECPPDATPTAPYIPALASLASLTTSRRRRVRKTTGLFGYRVEDRLSGAKCDAIAGRYYRIEVRSNRQIRRSLNTVPPFQTVIFEQ